MGLDKCTFTSEIVIVFFFICRRMLTKVIGALKQHVQSFYTQKDSSFTFQPFVSQVLLCDGTRINAVVLLRFHFISGRHLDICFAFFSLSCSGVRVTREMFLYSFQNIAPSDLPNLWCMYLNKEDLFCGHSFLSFLLSSLITFPPRSGWCQCRKLCLIVFGAGGFPSRWCSLASWRVTDSRRSLVPSPACSAWLSRLTRISWRAITAVFNNSRYPRKTCGNVL